MLTAKMIDCRFKMLIPCTFVSQFDKQAKTFDRLEPEHRAELFAQIHCFTTTLNLDSFICSVGQEDFVENLRSSTEYCVYFNLMWWVLAQMAATSKNNNCLNWQLRKTLSFCLNVQCIRRFLHNVDCSKIESTLCATLLMAQIVHKLATSIANLVAHSMGLNCPLVAWSIGNRVRLSNLAKNKI